MSNLGHNPQLINSRVPPWNGADRERVARQVQHLHNLGPRPLLEFLLELAAIDEVRDDIDLLLDRYHNLSPAMVAALDARNLKPQVFAVNNIVDDDVVDDDRRGRKAA